MEKLEQIIRKAQSGDLEAYDAIVHRFQNMAVGYGYTLLHDWHLAEDASQEAFLQAFNDLSALQEPSAFPGWLRRIVFKYCDRVTRRQKLDTTSLDEADTLACCDADTVRLLEITQLRVDVSLVINNLAPALRTVTLLYFIGGHSQRDIADFLGVHLSTVKKRLATARRDLRTGMIDIMKEHLETQRPSRDTVFAERVSDMLKAAATGDIQSLGALLRQDRRILHGEGEHFFWFGQSSPLHAAAWRGQREAVELLLDEGADIHAVSETGYTPLHVAATDQRHEIVDLLLKRGAVADIFTALMQQDTERVQALLRHDPQLINTQAPRGTTPLHYATTLETARLLVEAGADVKATIPNFGHSPLDTLWPWPEVRDYLIKRGAEPSIFIAAREGNLMRLTEILTKDPDCLNRPAPLYHDVAHGHSPMGVAIMGNQLPVVDWMLQHGADVNGRDTVSFTPLHRAATWGRPAIAALLLKHGADTSLRSSGCSPRWNDKTALDVAREVLQHGKVLIDDALLQDYERVMKLLESAAVSRR